MRQSARVPMQIRTDSLASRCIWLTLVIGGLWLLAIAPAQHYFGAPGVEAAAVSAVSCLLGGYLTFWLAARFTQPRIQAFAILFGTGIRGVFALLGALVMEILLGFS